MIICGNSNIDIIQGSSYGDAGGITDWRLENTSAGVFNIKNSNYVIQPYGGISEVGQIPNSTDRYIIFKEGTSTFYVPPGGIICDLLVVGGGGGGGDALYECGGGGGGGIVYMINKTFVSGTYNVIVGNGGVTGTVGGNSSITLNNTPLSFDGISVVGKGGGCGSDLGVNGGGGSGGGGNYKTPVANANYGIATQGNTFWDGTTYVPGGFDGQTGGRYSAGGGGGAGEVAGTDEEGNLSYEGLYNSGGGGRSVSITGLSIFYGGGGAGGGSGIFTGTDGGGGRVYNTANGAPGTPNTGGGGGGAAGNYSGGAGGSGIVILRYSIQSISMPFPLSIIDNGNIGFGTTPVISSSKLEIIGDINISGNYKKNNSDVIIDTSNYVLSTSNILSANILNSKSQWTTNSNMIYYNTSNVGIGTTYPTSKLHLFDNTISETKLTIQNSRLPAEIVVTGTTSGIIDTINRYIIFPNTGALTNVQYNFSPTEALLCDILIIGGGGGGGSGNASTTQYGGGGGAGGVVYMVNKTLSIGTYKINVGKGGEAATNGTNSSITDNSSNIITFDSIPLIGYGGGRGANTSATTVATRADAGGSGGGGGHLTAGATAGGASTQGNTFWHITSNIYVAGGFNGKTPTTTNRGGGGGGAGELGDTDGSGFGGDGRTVNITGTNTTYAGGGNAHPNISTTGSDGGGGTLNGVNSSQNGGAAVANTGSGGAGAYGTTTTIRTGGAGAAGIVIIKYRKITSSSSIELIRGTQNDSNRDYKIGNYIEDFIVKTSINGADTNYIKITGTTGAITNPSGTASWATTSDRRIKENIERASYDKCYENINKLELNRFNYIKGFNTVNRDIKQLGFIAQEVKDIFPKSVFEKSYINDTVSIPDLHSIDITQINYSLYGTVKKLIEINNDNKKNIKKIESILNINNIDIDNTLTSNIIIDTTLSSNNVM